MLSGIYRAAMGMTAELNIQDTLANNIANAGSTAFKRQIPVFSELMSLATKQTSSALKSRPSGITSSDGLTKYTWSSQGAFESAFDKTPGEIRHTGRDLDLALSGDAYFAIQGANGEHQYTRSGDFDVDPSGQLVTKQGNLVLSEQGPVFLGGGQISFSESGDIFEDGTPKGKLLISSLGSMNTVQEVAGGIFQSADAEPASSYSVQQGYLEQSNVNAVQEMVAMISSLRAYEAAQKVVTSSDTLLGKAVNEIGRV